MKKIAAIALVIGGLSWSSQQVVFRTGADAVTVDVSVSNGRRPVRGLAAADFEVLDSGVPQEVASLSFDSLPLDISFLIDVSHSMIDNRTANLGWPSGLPPPGLEAVSSGVSSVLRSLRSADRFQFIEFATTLREVAVTNGSVGLRVPSRDRYLARTAFFDALSMALIPSTDLGRRRIIIALTDAKDNASILDYRTRVRVIERSDAVVHVIAFGQRDARASVGQPTVELGWRFSSGGGFDDFLTDLVERTGGRFMRLMPGQDFNSLLASAIDEFRTRYVLHYVPRGVKEAGWHPLEVRVKRPGKYEIRARRGYDRGSRSPQKPLPH